MKRILFATDFSDSCDNTFEYLKSLIGDHEVIVDLIHVYTIPVNIATGVPHAAIKGMLDEKKNASIRRMSELRDQLNELQKGKIYPIYGVYPSSEIAEVAKHADADLIVTALRQKYSLMERMIGTVTAHTIQKSDIPVLAIPNQCEYRPINNIIFPTQINVSDKLAQREIDALTWLYGFWEIIKQPQIHVVHIDTDINKKNYLELTFKNKPFADMDFTLSSADTVEEGILEYMSSHDVDLLALYKPHRNLWERIYRSSVTRQLLYKSRLPLLVLLEKVLNIPFL